MVNDNAQLYDWGNSFVGGLTKCLLLDLQYYQNIIGIIGGSPLTYWCVLCWSVLLDIGKHEGTDMIKFKSCQSQGVPDFFWL